MLMNAGGVTVSYFEWLKNLQHVRFGRMTRRWEEHSKRIIVDQLVRMGAKLDAKESQALMVGPSERDIVYSGLEDTMATVCRKQSVLAACLFDPSAPPPSLLSPVMQAVAETIATAESHNVSYRLAGFINAIKKIEVSYRDAGLTI
jgi:hypothetical protein